jgi:hypothetical protein
MSTKTEFTFKELSAKAKNVAIEGYQDMMASMDLDWHYIVEDMQTELEKYGIEIAKVSRGRNGKEEFDFSYSGFWSQGDGASFTTEWFTPWEYIKATKQSKKYKKLVDFYKKFEKARNEFTAIGQVYRISSHYAHSKTVSLRTEVNCRDLPSTYNPKPETVSEAENMAEEVLQEMFEFCQDKMNEIYERLEEDYKHTMSEESAKEYFNDLDITFDKTGKKL